MSNNRAANLGTYNLTPTENGMVLGQTSGITRFSIQCTSATAVTIKGNKQMKSIPLEGGGNVDLNPVAIDVAENEVFNWSVGGGIDEVIIGIPGGATAKLTVL